MDWQPIKKYDNLEPKQRPKLAVFWFKGTPPLRGQTGTYGLEPTPNFSRVMGNRVCTHYMQLPEPPIELAGASS